MGALTSSAHRRSTRSKWIEDILKPLNQTEPRGTRNSTTRETSLDNARLRVPRGVSRNKKRFALGNGGLTTTERTVLITVEDESNYALVLINFEKE